MKPWAGCQELEAHFSCQLPNNSTGVSVSFLCLPKRQMMPCSSCLKCNVSRLQCEAIYQRGLRNVAAGASGSSPFLTQGSPIEYLSGYLNVKGLNWEEVETLLSQLCECSEPHVSGACHSGHHSFTACPMSPLLFLSRLLTHWVVKTSVLCVVFSCYKHA